LSPEARLISYLLFIGSLFLFSGPVYYLFAGLVLALLLTTIEFRILKAGWIPVSIFLIFTFVSNAVHHPGRIIWNSGPVLLTGEGLELASLRTGRVLLMIAGVKFLMATTTVNGILGAVERLLKPFEKAGVPVKDFFDTMGLTMRCFPLLKDSIARTYKEMMRTEKPKGFWEKVRLTALFLLPLFVESILYPEVFFTDGREREKTD
jgi:energy-coupling factor transport system permease protein